jgi:site-specific DNA-methyltransferase (adenine-specific)
MNKIIQGDCLEVMKTFDDNYIDLTVTSPPYDNLRDYKGYSFNFEGIAKELYRITKKGGVVVWVVGDATVKGSETGTSFKQALYFKEIGFNLHDTMIYNKTSTTPVGGRNRYFQRFEYMFIFSKGKPVTFNPITRKRINKHNDNRKTRIKNTSRNKDGSWNRKFVVINEIVKISNVWEFMPGNSGGKIESKHPAIFPEKLAEDHILSWSNEGDIVLDPMAGSGTTLKMAKLLNRNYIGIEISEEYCDIIKERLK